MRKLNAAVVVCRYFPVINVYTYDFRKFIPVSPGLSSLSLYTINAQGGYFHIVWLGGDDAAGFAKVLPFTRVNFANFVILYQSTFSIFCYYKFA